MAFQIKDKTGNIVTNKELNQQAFDFWKSGAKINDLTHASPVKVGTDLYEVRSLSLNWYDRIGGAIHNSESNQWEKVEEKILEPWLKHFEPDDIMESPDFEYNVRAFLNLITHWKTIGYTPFYIKD